jgi:hypothetical protein
MATGTASEMYGGLSSELFVVMKVLILWLHVKFAWPTSLAWLPCLCNVSSPSVRRQRRYRTLISCRWSIQLHLGRDPVRQQLQSAALISLDVCAAVSFVHHKTQKHFGRNNLYIFIAWINTAVHFFNYTNCKNRFWTREATLKYSWYQWHWHVTKVEAHSFALHRSLKYFFCPRSLSCCSLSVSFFLSISLSLSMCHATFCRDVKLHA